MTHEYKATRFTIGDNGVAHFVMARPDILNPLTDDLRRDFVAMLDEVEGNTKVRALVISGEGRAFSAGGDVKGMAARKFGDQISARQRMYSTHNWLERLWNLDCPVIAAVDGLAYGGGFAFALLADFIFASEKARFCSVFGRIGLMPDLALLYTLPRVVGLQAAKDLMYTCRSIDVEEAKAMGVVYRQCRSETLMAEVEQFAGMLARGSRAAMAVTKRVANRTFEATYGENADAEADGQPLLFGTEFHQEAVRRFVAKEPPMFDWDRLSKSG
ncbi:MAG: enoyl-CoA hydratase/isomerase family protein [Pseudomonadota bacterium]|nr:enoyl-CoA hydratase/isomerase family protein [Pseudomonadota bacterium]